MFVTIFSSTCIFVITVYRCVCNFTGLFIAGINGTQVSVINRFRVRVASCLAATRVISTRIVIVTFNVSVFASRFRIARLFSANIVVSTINISVFASFRRETLVNSTSVVVITVDIINVIASNRCFAGIRCTSVRVIAVYIFVNATSSFITTVVGT